MKTVSEWSSGPSHNKTKEHAIHDVRFLKGQNSTIECKCGWRSTGPTHGAIERAYVDHRRSLGLSASILTINFNR